MSETHRATGPALGEISDAWLVGRGRELIAIVQRSDYAEQRSVIEQADELLAEAQHRGEPLLVAQTLRVCAFARLVTPGHAEEAEPRLDELLAHTRRHGIAALRADAHAMRGRKLLLDQQDDAALTEIARALAILDDGRAPQGQLTERNRNRLLSAALNACWVVLNQLGIYEAAEEVLARAHHVSRDSASPHEIATQLMNRVKMLLGWGLRLERIGHHDEATERFRTAAAMATATEEPFSESLFPRRTGVPALDQVGVLAAALALAEPGEEHIARLSELHEEIAWPSEKYLLTIALARCLHSRARRAEAMKLLRDARDGQQETGSQSSVRLSVALELAKFGDEEAGDDLPEAGTRALSWLADYVNELEGELWALRQSQVATLNTRREHERLSAEHGAITQQAMHDPLTGMPNRRALDEQLRNLASSTSAHPLAVALVDLDGFKDVNDRHSHAAGDDVLRVVASTLRDTLRGDDVVSRYGGDEFIILLPGAAIPAAEQALNRSVTGVATLPHHLSRGVTLSVGMVTLRPHESAEQVLSRADAAMYQAKKHGGNQIASTTGETSAPGVRPGVDTAHAASETADETAGAASSFRAPDWSRTDWPRIDPEEFAKHGAGAESESS